MNKAEARRHGDAARSALPPSERIAAARRLAAGLPIHPLVAALEPGNVLVPSHHRNEIDPEPLARHLEDHGWTLHRPRTVPARTTIEAVPWPARKPLVPGYAGIPEPPRTAPAADPGRLNLIVVPGAAFAKDGARVGTGQGYFDRFLEPLMRRPLPPLLIGIGYRMQLLPSVPAEPHDIPMHGLQLEDLALDCRRRD